MLLNIFESFLGLLLDELRFFKSLRLLWLSHYLLRIFLLSLLLHLLLLPRCLQFASSSPRLDDILLVYLILGECLIESLERVKLLKHTQVQIVLLLTRLLAHKLQTVQTCREHLVVIQ